MSAPLLHCQSMKTLIDVDLRDAAPVVDPDPGADHANHDCGCQSHGRPKGPAGIPADSGTDESEEFSHTR